MARLTKAQRDELERRQREAAYASFFQTGSRHFNDLADIPELQEVSEPSTAPVLPVTSTEEEGFTWPSPYELALQAGSGIPGPIGTLFQALGVGTSTPGQIAINEASAQLISGRADSLNVQRRGGELNAGAAEDLRSSRMRTLMPEQVHESVLPEALSVTKQKELMEREQALRARAQDFSERSQSLQDTVGGRWNPVNVLARAAGGVAGQPEMVIPAIGGIIGGAGAGPAGAVAGAGIGSLPMVNRAYNAAFAEAEEWGFTPEESQDYAALIAAAEFGPSLLGGAGTGIVSGAMRRFGVQSLAKDQVEKAARRRLGARVAATMGFGALDEASAEWLGGQVRSRISDSEDFASEEALANLGVRVAEEKAEGWRRFIDPAAAGALGSGAIGGSTAAYTSAAQAGRDAAITDREMLRSAVDAGSRGDAERASIEALFSAADREAAFDRRDQIDTERGNEQLRRAEEDGWGIPDPQRVADETESGFREIERQQQAEGLSRLGNVTDARSPITPETIAAERQAEVEAQQRQEREVEESRLEQERQDREAQEAAAQQRREEEVATRRAALQRQQASQQRQQGRQQRAARQQVVDETIAENPDATDAEILDLVDQRLNDPNFETEREVAQVRRKEEAAQQAQETKRHRESIRAARRASPDMSDREIAAYLNTNRAEGEAPTTVEDVQASREPQPQQHTTPIPENAPVQQKINTLAEDMGINLGMAASAVDASTPSYVGTYLDKSRKFIRGLVDMDTRGSVAVQNLIRQGKVIIVPNPQFANMDPSNNVAEFSPETGEMFIYTDHMSDNPNAAREIVKTIHESGHFLQQGTREGRSATLESIFGSDGHNIIRQAAERGDERAQRAVARATELFPDNETVQNLEIPAYFFNEVVDSGATLGGRMRNFVPNVVSRTRNLLRDRLGVDLEVTANDIAASVDAVLEEAVATDIQPQGLGASLDNLGMIYNRDSVSPEAFQRAVDNGWVYDSVDGRQKYVLSDEDSYIPRTKARQLVESNSTMRVGDLMEHEVLYNEVPAAADVRIYTVDSFPGAPLQFAAFDPNPTPNEIIVRKDVALGSDPDKPTFREAVMHEMQHFVQEQGGQGDQSYVESPDITAVRNRFAQANDAHARASRELLDNARPLSQELDRRSREEVMDVLMDRDMSDVAKSAIISEILQDTPTEYTPELQAVIDRFVEARAERNGMLVQYNDAMNRAGSDYLSNINEREAFRTQADVDTTEAEIRSRGNPEPEMAEQSTAERPDTSGRIDVPEAPQQQLAAGEASPLSAMNETGQPVTLGMASPEAVGAQPNSRRVLEVPVSTWMRALWDPAIGTGRISQAIIENAQSAPADTMMLAEKYASEYDKGLGTLAAERNMTPAQLNEEITAKLEAISDREDSYDANLEAFRNVTKDYGKAGEALNRLRDTVDRLSMDMLEQRAQQAREGRPLTEAEKERYSTIVNNLGRYAHRMYAAGMGKQGKKWGNTVWNDWKEGENAHNYHLVENAVNHLVDNELYIPSAEEMAGTSVDTLRRLVGTWNLGNPEAMTKAQMQDILLDKREIINGDKGRMDSMAQTIVQELLGLKDQDTPITNYYRGGKLNDAILRERKNIPEPIRELLGEITHPAGRLMVTAGKQAEFVARNTMLMELREASESDASMREHLQSPDATGTPEAEGMAVLRGASYGPLEGYLASPNMKALLGDTIQQLATFEQATAMAAQRPGVLTDAAIRRGLGVYGTVARTEKAVKIIGNPVNFLYNFLGAPDMLLKNGNLDPRIAAKAMSTAARVIATTRDPSNASPESRRIQRAGVTDSAFIGEINRAQWRKLEGIIREMEGKSPAEAMQWLRSRGAATVELYAMMDVWSKIANFYHQADTVLPNFYKAEGIEKTQEQIDREAADIVNRTNITYKRAAPLVKAMEQAGITQFGTYFYETFRVEVTNVMQGIDELKRANRATSPEGRNIMRAQGTKRLAGQLTSWGLKGYLGNLAAKALFGDDEEERRDVRSLLPDYLQNQDFVPVGFTDVAVGNRNIRMPVTMNASRLDPTGPSSDIMRSMLHEDASPDKILEDIVDLYIAPRFVGQTFKALMSEIDDSRISREPLMSQLDAPGYSFVSNTFGANRTRAWSNVVESFLPGIATAYRDTNERPDVEDPVSALAAALTYSGATMYITDPSRAASRVSYEYGNTVTNLRRDVADYFNTNTGDINEDQLLSRLLSMQNEERDAYEEVARVYRGAQHVGLRPREIATILKDNGVPAEVITQLQMDRFEPRFISKESIDRYAQNEMTKGNKTREEKRDIKRKWDEAWRILNRQQRELRRDDG